MCEQVGLVDFADETHKNVDLYLQCVD